MNKAIVRWEAMAAPLKGVKIVTYHQDWTYFANRFGLQIIGSIELKPGIEPTPNHLVALTQACSRRKLSYHLRSAKRSLSAPTRQPDRGRRGAVAANLRRIA